jgi:phenylacetic acid degradation protein PaaD
MHEHLDIARKRFSHDNYAKHLGIVLDDLTHDIIRMHMKLRDDMLNWFSRVHGGAIYALADAAFSVLANNSNNLAVALDCSITYHASPEPGALLVVEGEKLFVSRRTASYLFKVYMEHDEKRSIVATMKSVSYRTGKPIDHSVEQ